MRRIIRSLTMTSCVLALAFACAKKDEQMEDPMSEFDEGMSDPGYDFFGENENFELTDEFAPITEDSAFGDLDPYIDRSENDPMFESEFGYNDGAGFDDAGEGYEFASDPANNYDSYDNFQEAPASTPSTTMPQHHHANLSGRYVVQPSDTLAIISRRVYQDINRWRDLAQQNNIANPSLIHPGDVIEFDTNDNNGSAYARKQNGSFQTVTVQHGDTLASIASRTLGTSLAWKYLWRFNEDKISNPHRIYAGQVLRYRNFDRNGRGIAH